jgi:hypothetical protein
MSLNNNNGIRSMSLNNNNGIRSMSLNNNNDKIDESKQQ